MAKTNFSPGTIVSSAWLNSIQSLIFDTDPGNPLYDGHYYRLDDTQLSNAAGNIKPDWYGFKNQLLVTAGTGLNVSYNAGSAILPTGALATISPGSILLADNATNYVFVNPAGTVATSTILPVLALMLAKVVTVGGTISGSIIDLRPRFSVLPKVNAIKIMGGSGDQGDYSLTGTATFDQGEYYFRNFSIESTGVLTIAGSATIYVSGNCNIAGTININYASSGGASFSTGVIGNIGGLSGSGPGAGSGSSFAVNAATYNYTLSRFGSGGASGFLNLPNAANGTIAPGGRGGGGLVIEAAGAINVAGTIVARGQVGGVGAVSGGTASGGGGGSGGLILFKCLANITIAPTATLDVRGGNGGNAVAGDASGGGGGGGGQVVLISPANNATSATVLLAGGSPGANLGSGTIGGGNGAAFGGNGGNGGGGTPTAGGSGQLILRNFVPVA
jgi:hypothetical protein